MPNIRLDLPNLTPQMLNNLCGANNQTLKRIEEALNIQLSGQAAAWHIQGDNALIARNVLQKLAYIAQTTTPPPARIELLLREHRNQALQEGEKEQRNIILKAGRRNVQGKTPNQRRYLQIMQDQTLTIAVGPAGCGKTYLAVAAAVVALSSHQVERIILTRPAVEAGEKLGFLPGDLQQKVDPYLRPLFDALTDMLGVEKMNTLMEQGLIEIAPLAYMRGRTLNDAFVILDEAQNTTRTQMKMFLTRLGFSSKMVVTGDATQIDLPNHQQSGLLHALTVLRDVKAIGVCQLSSHDVIRHQLVESIVEAYEAELS
ncbi:MAG: PhoH family protein [Mariprofundaceae bacterium]|nr:PhoH family protein [Mariprofundaceae bacterium]